MEIYVDLKAETVKYYGLDKYDGMTTTLYENGLDGVTDEDEIKEHLADRLGIIEQNIEFHIQN